MYKNKGHYWGWVRNAYCSTQSNIVPEQKWLFEKSKVNSSLYNIVDLNRSTLKVDNNSSSIYKYKVYASYPGWYDSDHYFNSYKLNEAGKVYANRYLEAKENKITEAYNAIKNFYKNKYLLTTNSTLH